MAFVTILEYYPLVLYLSLIYAIWRGLRNEEHDTT